MVEPRLTLTPGDLRASKLKSSEVSSEKQETLQLKLKFDETPSESHVTKKTIFVETVAEEQSKEYLDKTFKKKWRWLLLILCSSMVISNYFCFDNPAALEVQIQEVFDKQPAEYGLLYTVYALPNTVLPLVGGLLIDRIGNRNALLIFTLFLCIG